MIRCSRCKALLSNWEAVFAQRAGVSPCWCNGIPTGVARTLANITYAQLCQPDLERPVAVHDVIRFVEPHYQGDPRHSIRMALSRDKRFCWAGRSLYGLARHGLVPGVRTLAEAAYAVLLGAPRELHFEETDFILEQMNYRFNRDSLIHLLRGYIFNRSNLEFQASRWNHVSVDRTRAARREFNAKIGACPTQVTFDRWVEAELAPNVERLLSLRSSKLAGIKDEVIQIAGDRLEFDDVAGSRRHRSS